MLGRQRQQRGCKRLFDDPRECKRRKRTNKDERKRAKPAGGQKETGKKVEMVRSTPREKTSRELREMASGLVLTSIQPAVIRASAADGRGRRKGPAKSAAGGGGGNNWWVPLFGWSAEPDYIDGAGAGAGLAEDSSKKGATASAGEEERRRRAGRRFAAFTEEKAKELRMRTMEAEAFHDVMYHSAIASRLASDLPRRPSSADS
ncbi:hypothetical protein GW17_00045268 [Ensete ventricosum]|nr:hypothetical protein GW17_00045268 [Ensete ventricosum]RZS21970.1 hypothetical protein BHM03_00054695 [Ensete ventricosum]